MIFTKNHDGSMCRFVPILIRIPSLLAPLCALFTWLLLVHSCAWVLLSSTLEDVSAAAAAAADDDDDDDDHGVDGADQIVALPIGVESADEARLSPLVDLLY